MADKKVSKKTEGKKKPKKDVARNHRGNPVGATKKARQETLRKR